jgi:hypothetical protein
MLRLFKGTGPGVILITIALAVLFWIGSFPHPETHEFVFSIIQMPLSQALVSIIGSSAILPLIISLVFILLVASMIVSFNTGTFFINERTFLPAILYVLLSSIFPNTAFFNPALPATAILVFAIMRISDSYRQPDISYNYFDAALVISAGSLLYANLIWFELLLFVGLFLLRNINLKEVLITLIGIVTPYALLYGFYYVSGKDLSDLTSLIGNSLFKDSDTYSWSRMQIIILIFLGITFSLGLVYLISVFNSKKVKSRKIFSLLIWTLIISVLVYLIVPSASVEIFYIFLVPATCILSNYYVSRQRKKIVPELMFTGTIILVVAFQVLRLLDLSI